MNEDDTFRKLKRPSWDEIFNLILRKINGFGLIFFKADVEKYGWTVEEFMKEYDKRYPDV